MTQTGQILKMLKKAGSKGVKNYELARVALRYSSRIRELREEGYDIYVERKKLSNGRVTNVFEYFLIKDKEVEEV